MWKADDDNLLRYMAQPSSERNHIYVASSHGLERPKNSYLSKYKTFIYYYCL